MRTLTLHSTLNGSDKIYRISLETRGDGHVVNYANGRRGGTLATGTKTQAPVALDKANAIFDKLARDKIAKGYVVVAGDDSPGIATLAADLAGQRVGFAAMLCNPIEADDVERLVADDAWIAQRKFDGERRGVIVAGGCATGANRRGLAVALDGALASAALALGDDLILDGEQIGDRFFAFDLLRHAGDDLRAAPLRLRLARLEALMAGLAPSSPLWLAETAPTPAAKRALVARERDGGQEGVVFKRADSLYQAGRPNSGGAWLKHKFYATLSALVTSHNSQRSVNMALVETSGRTIDVGAVTIPSNKDVPAPGAIIEVRYLYAYPGGSLYQPVYLGERTDLGVKDCRAAQRKFVANNAA